MIFPTRLLPLFLLWPAFTAAKPSFTAFKEKTCTDPLKIYQDGEEIPDGKLAVTHALRDWDHHAAGNYYDNLTFPDAGTSGEDDGSAGAQYVFWKAEKPDPGCQLIMMKDTNLGWQVLNKLPGVEILRISSQGCYYTSLNENDGLIASFCCGYDDCAVAEIEVENQRQQGIAVENNPSCTVKKESISATPTKQSGKQIAVTRPQTCEASPACTHSIQLSYSFTAAVANFFAYTWTDEIGTEVSLEAGVDFLGDAKTTSSWSESISQSFMSETGLTVTEGNITSPTQGGRQMPGTLAFYSFTPAYNCWKCDLSCGNDADGKEKVMEGIDICQPRLGHMGEADGEYRMVYISD